MRFESAFGTVFTRTRASENSTLQTFFPAKSNVLEFEISLGKVTSTNDLYHAPIFHTTESSQSSSKWFKQREKKVPLNYKPRRVALFTRKTCSHFAGCAKGTAMPASQ